ncbi:MAG: FHA domain-containing protein, partial [Actinomycetota bacterium]
DTTTIGRDPGHEIVLDAPAVSRAHAVVERTPHGYSLRDLASRNGTFLNGERLDGTPHPLRDEDEIVVAGIETFRFVDPLATPISPRIGRLTGVWVDPDSGAVWVDAQLVEPPLSGRQQALVELLAANVDTIVTRETIIATVWADVAAEGVSAGAIDALVKRVKGRFRPLQQRDDYLEVVRDRGIRLRSA